MIAIRAFELTDARWTVGGAATRGTWTTRSAAIIAITTDGGATGLGEAAPLPDRSLESLDDDRRALALLARSTPREIATPAEALALAAELAATPAARFAIETALLAAFAQQARTSIARVLVAAPATALATAPVVDDVASAERVLRGGARAIKLKATALPLIAEVARLAREYRARLRIDVNQQWADDDAFARLGALVAAVPPGVLDYVEEPCPGSIALLARALPCPIALDESLVALDDAGLRNVIDSRSLAALVLKPTVLGGFARCLELAALARDHGVRPIASHALEGPVAFAATCELARAIATDAPVGLASYPVELAP